MVKNSPIKKKKSRSRAGKKIQTKRMSNPYNYYPIIEPHVKGKPVMKDIQTVNFSRFIIYYDPDKYTPNAKTINPQLIFLPDELKREIKKQVNA